MKWLLVLGIALAGCGSHASATNSTPLKPCKFRTDTSGTLLATQALLKRDRLLTTEQTRGIVRAKIVRLTTIEGYDGVALQAMDDLNKQMDQAWADAVLITKGSSSQVEKFRAEGYAALAKASAAINRICSS